MDKKTTINATEGNRPVMDRQKAVLLSVAMLVIGFISGAAFGVLKTTSLSDRKTAVSNASPPQMLQALEGEAAQNPQNADIWARLGHAYFDTDQYQKAIDAYEKSLAIEPGNPNVLTDLGVMYRRNKQPRKALEMFSKAIAHDPKHEVSRMNKGIVLLHDLNDEQGAIEAWEELLKINPLAAFGNGQTVDEKIRHYKEGHDKGENEK